MWILDVDLNKIVTVGKIEKSVRELNLCLLKVESQ